MIGDKQLKHLFIVNPIAGGRNAAPEVAEKVRAAFENRTDEYEIYVTKAPMDATEKIKEDAALYDSLRVYACGGDGTFNECVCGAAGLENVSLAPFPTGTGNDFCRMFGEEAGLYHDINRLLDGKEIKIDLIDCNGRLCANICSVGIDARIGTDVHKYSHIPLIGGATGYVVSAIVNVFKGISRKMTVRCGTFTQEGEHSLICVCNGRFYGGGFNPSLYARPDDGELDFYIVKKVSLLAFAALIGKYAAGRADEIPKYITHLRGTEISIDFEEENVINIDGEAMFAKNVVMRLVPHALNLVIPTGMTFFDK